MTEKDGIGVENLRGSGLIAGETVTSCCVRVDGTADRRPRVGPVVVAVARAQRLAVEVIVLSEDSG